MNQRQRKIEAQLQRGVGEFIARGLSDTRIRGLVSVTRVSVSPDLAEATVFISVLPGEHADLTLHGLKHAVGHIQSSVGKQLRLRRVPRLSFRLDQSLKRAADLHTALAREQRDDNDSDGPQPCEETTP